MVKFKVKVGLCFGLGFKISVALKLVLELRSELGLGLGLLLGLLLGLELVLTWEVGGWQEWGLFIRFMWLRLEMTSNMFCMYLPWAFCCYCWKFKKNYRDIALVNFKIYISSSYSISHLIFMANEEESEV